jgi:hypothetical protein
MSASLSEEPNRKTRAVYLLMQDMYTMRDDQSKKRKREKASM